MNPYGISDALALTNGVPRTLALVFTAALIALFAAAS